jgi:hypothetical protein
LTNTFQFYTFNDVDVADSAMDMRFVCSARPGDNWVDGPLAASPVSPVRETGLFMCKPTPVSSDLPADLFQAAFREVSFRVPSADPVCAEQLRVPA